MSLTQAGVTKLGLCPDLVLICLCRPRCYCSSFSQGKLYFHCQAMKCLCTTPEHTAINLTAAELTGQKPMQPLLGTEHYQCMDSLFIRGSIRHCSLCCHAGYEDRKTASQCWSHGGTTRQRNQGIKLWVLLDLLQPRLHHVHYKANVMTFNHWAMHMHISKGKCSAFKRRPKVLLYL